MSSPEEDMDDPRLMPSIWGPEQVALAGHNNFIPILQNLMQSLLKKFLTMGTRERIWLILSFIILVGAYLLWPILFSLRVDGDTSMSWSTVWIPLWVIDTIGLVFFLLLLSWGPIRVPPSMEDGWRDPYPMELRALALVEWLLLVLFQVFLVRRLDGHTDWSWWKVLSPLMSWLGVNTFRVLYSLCIQTRRLLLGRFIEAFRVMIENVVLMVQLVLLVLKLEVEVDWNWWVVFIPLWLYHLGHFLGWLLNHLMAAWLVMGIEESQGCSQEEQQKILESAQLLDTAKGNRCTSCGSLVMSILAVNLVNGADYSTFLVFIPQFLSAAMLVCTVSCVICCFRAAPGELNGINSLAGV